MRWELDVNPRWKRDPTFYIEQTLTPIVEALVVPGPYNAKRSGEILTRIENMPAVLQQAAQNLDNPPAAFATVAAQSLASIRERLHKMAASLVSSTTLKEQDLNAAVDRAAEALEKFQQQLKEKLPTLPQQTALGRDAYVFFLKNVALMPYSAEELLAMGQQEWNRAVAFEAYEKNRNKNLPPLKIADNIDNWIKDTAVKELQIRKFLDERDILTMPDWLQHYTFRPMPEYLRVLSFGENDDFTSPSRLKENCIRYVSEPSPNAGYFFRATAADPRPLTVHEGIPGHYFQLCLSWKHEDPIRRHYYDSGANEGIGLQLHASASATSGGRRETRAWPIHTRTGREISAGKSANGCEYGAPGGNCLFDRSGAGNDLSNRQVTDYEIPRGYAIATGSKVQPARLPRFCLEDRQRADRVAALGIPGRERSGP